MSLEEIRELVGERTPEGVAAVFTEQKKRMKRQMEALRHRLGMLQVYIDTLNHTMEDRKIGGFIVKELPTESLVLGPVIEDFNYENADQYFVDFFNDMVAKGIVFGFPLGSMVTRKNLLNGKWEKIRRMYFRSPLSKHKKRSGLYAIGYSRGDFFNHDELYHTLVKYINDNCFEIAGNAYEDYILDSILVSDPEDYLMRLSIEVREKE